MQTFEYANPKTLKEAFALLGSNWNDAAVLAGGTDILNLMKDYIETPKRVVSIRGLKELGGVSSTRGGLRIGAGVTLDELLNNQQIRSEFPALHAAVRGVNSQQIRNMGTVGGDLLQRPRCWYYRNGHGLLGMKDGKSLIPEGENQYHAIFGSGPAYFVNPSSLAPALIAYGAKVTLASAAGTRQVDVSELYAAPADANGRETTQKPNEILTEVTILDPARRTRNATYEIRERDAMDWPLATASVALTMGGNTIKTARVVLGHVAPTPWAVPDVDKMLVGKAIDEQVAEEAGKLAVAGAKPLSQNAYKVQLAKVAVKRALLTAVGKAV